MSVLKITKDNFQKEVMESEKTVLVDFFATWCGPCSMVSPIIDDIANEVDQVKVVKVDVDDQPELAAQFQVMSIPTLVVIKNGEVVNRSLGAKSKKQILDLIK